MNLSDNYTKATVRGYFRYLWEGGYWVSLLSVTVCYWFLLTRLSYVPWKVMLTLGYVVTLGVTVRNFQEWVLWCEKNRRVTAELKALDKV